LREIAGNSGERIVREQEGGISLLFLSVMASQRPNPGATGTSDERPCTSAHARGAANSRTATGPQQSTCHRPSTRGAATGGKTEGERDRCCDTKRLRSKHMFLHFRQSA
jgi:hypothetical protein